MFNQSFRPLSVVELIYRLEGIIMGKLDDLKADLADFIVKAKADHDTLAAQVADLLAKVGAGGTVTDADLQGVIDTIDQAKAALVTAAPVVALEPAPAPAEPAPPAAPAQ